MAIKVLIYEDNENLRKSIQALLLWNNEFDIVAAMPDATSVTDDIVVLKPDVVLMDIDMPVCNGVQAVTQIRKKTRIYPSLCLLFLMMMIIFLMLFVPEPTGIF